MQKWEEIEQKKEYLKGYIKAKNRETLIKDQIQQLRLGMMLPAINKMNDEQEKEALTRYYLLRENNKAIQRKMGVSKAKLYRIYDSALENFEIL